MAYIRHNPGEAKHYGHSFFEEEKEKKEKEEAYQKSKEYAAAGENKEKLYNAGGDEKDVSQDYLKAKKQDDKKEDENKESIESTIKKELPGDKYKKKEDTEEAELHKGIAQEMGGPSMSSPKEAKKKKHKSIEEAIDKAVKQEKEVIHLD